MLTSEVQEVKRIDLDTANFNSVQIKSKSQNIFHYRCKAADPDVTIQIMKSLHIIVGNDWVYTGRFDWVSAEH